MKWLILPMGNTLIDPGGSFGVVPRMMWERYAQPNKDGLVEMALLSLLIESDGKWILVDTGLGSKLNDLQRSYWQLSHPQGTLIENLAKLSLKPEDIDYVVNTHLHSDHCGGNTHLLEGKLVPTFTNAQYVIQRKEYEDACRPNERTRATYYAENFQPIAESGQLLLIDGEYALTNQVSCVSTPGHTRGHQSVVIDDSEQSALFVGDMATFAVQFAKLAWVTAYDLDPMQSIETKRHWQQWALEKDAQLIFEHEVDKPIGKLKHVRKDKYKIEKVEEHEGLKLLK